MRSPRLSRREWTLAAIGVLGFSVVGYGIFSAESDEEKIRAVLANLAHAVKVDPDAPNILVRAGKINQAFSEIFTEEVSYLIPERTSGRHGRKELARLATEVGPFFTSLEITFTELEIEIAEATSSAQVNGIAVGSGIQRGQRWQEERQVQFSLIRHDGDWQIDKLTVVPNSEKESE
jgi:hypothetical protein